MKNNEIEKLKELYLKVNRLRYPNLPEYARAVPKYSDKKTNGLTKCIIDYIRFNGFHAERTSNEGRIIDNRKRVTNVLGWERQIGSIQRIKSSNQKGTSDIKAVVNGKFIAIEVKNINTKDKQSEAQKEYEKEIKSSGGIYYIAKDFSSFYNWFNELINL